MAGGTTRSPDTFSLQLELLPFMEQQQRYETILSYRPTLPTDNTNDWEPGGWWHGNSTPNVWGSIHGLENQISVFSCPSDVGTRPVGNEASNVNYMYSVGDVIGGDSDRSRRGFFSTDPNSFQGMNAIHDGTSNTIAFAESAIFREPNRIRGAIAVFTDASFNSSTAPITCANIRATGDNTVFNISGDVTASETYRGRRFADGRAARTSVMTVLPPNSPSCMARGSSVHESNNGVYSATSYHPGGVNVCLGDGSVRFVSDTVDCGNQNVGFPSLTGESPYGVWGAYGSRDGGESRTL
jgi:prepilin-type processing-associated H-X9-DG protein